MREHWRLEGPPVHIMVAAYMGWEPGKVPAAGKPDRRPAAAPAGVQRVRAVEDLAGFTAAFQAAGGALQ